MMIYYNNLVRNKECLNFFFVNFYVRNNEIIVIFVYIVILCFVE